MSQYYRDDLFRLTQDAFQVIPKLTCLKQISDYLNVDVVEYVKTSFDKELGYMIIELSQIKLCILRIDILNDPTKFSAMLHSMNLDYFDSMLDLNNNITEYSWHGDKYDQFKIAIKTSQANYLSDEDRFIVELFFS